MNAGKFIFENNKRSDVKNVDSSVLSKKKKVGIKWFIYIGETEDYYL